ncbi:MAG: hypothetical protein ABIB71_02515 [Candidatus Woesearchaeota archaeon]
MNLEIMGYKCQRCGREINHLGRCLPCNYLYKHKKYFGGLRESPEYDSQHGMDIGLAKKIISERTKKPNASKKEDFEKYKPARYEKVCGICQNGFRTNHEEYKICYECYKLFHDYGRIKDYNEFLDAFDLEDSPENKEYYIEFVDKLKKFIEINGEWEIEKILKDPRKYLDKINVKAK